MCLETFFFPMVDMLLMLGFLFMLQRWIRAYVDHFFFSILQRCDILELVQAAKAARLEKFEVPAKIVLLPEPWTPESGLVTAALKLKREQIKAKFKGDLDKLYH
jgi:hypothetical protein